jgi:hypothetical protein
MPIIIVIPWIKNFKLEALTFFKFLIVSQKEFKEQLEDALLNRKKYYEKD